ncbi:MAG: hypothetical protein KDE51_18595, partial [Anaerolineales bacterium]|nr:hypothetical protein [Anaerolineales bacterium]
MFTRLARLTWVQWLVGLLILSGTAVYGLHLGIGYAPPPVALSLLGINLYGSAFLVVAAVLLSAAVVYAVARHNAQQRFNTAVPQTIRQRPLDTLPLNPAFLPQLSSHRLNTVGALLFRWGLNPRTLDFTDAQLTQLGTELLEDEQIKAEWIFSPTWRPFDPTHVWRGLSWMVVFGLIGARLYHILAPSPEFVARTGIASTADYFQNPTQLINFSQG